MSESLEEATVTTRSDMSESSEEATVTCSTSKGEFKMKFYRKWSPNGYDRCVELFSRGFYNQSHFFRGERIVENPESNLCLSLATLSTDTRPRLASLISFVFIPSRTWLQHLSPTSSSTWIPSAVWDIVYKWQGTQEVCKRDNSGWPASSWIAPGKCILYLFLSRTSLSSFLMRYYLLRWYISLH